MIIYNTLVRTGAFDDFKRWLVAQATADVRVQAILLAWALGALLEGLVGFGYPWAVVAPILVGLGVVELDAIRVAWGALIVAPVIFGLATVFNFSGMANTLAHGFAQIGPAFLILAPVIGFIGVALSGSNTSTNALFGGFQYSVGGLLHMPSLLLPPLSSVGAEIGKPIAPQTTSVGVSTSKYVRREGQVIRYNLPWTLLMLGYLILIALFYRGVLPAAMQP